MNHGPSAGQLAALRQAAQWFSQLNSGEAQAADYSAWQHWLDATPDNAWAWQQAERLQSRVARNHNPATTRLLDLSADSRRASRRSVLRSGLLLLGGSALSVGGYREIQHASWLADYRSGVGEQRALTLRNGSRVQLNTASAVDIDDRGERPYLRLRQGEIMVSVPAQQSCCVQTGHGRVDAGQSRFAVRLFDDASDLRVHEQQARITLASGQSQVVNSGQGCRFDDTGFAALQPISGASDAWAQGLMIANDQRLDNFITDLARYRPGWLRCTPQVANLRISGTFRLKDTEQILRALTSSLPVRLESRTRYWVTVTAA